LVKGDKMKSAIEVLMTILKEKKLRGGTGNIKGSYNCICFTETPIAQLALSLADRAGQQFKYRPVGIMVDKEWAFTQGARPAIYQTDEEYASLPEPLRYRHVRYEPSNKVDFTWEREWRLRADELPFTPSDVTLIVPARKWADILIESHIQKIKRLIATQGTEAVTEPHWHIVALSDLGIDVPAGLD